jgi:hypothetical protein
VLLVHDEIVIETPEDRVKAATTWLRKAMEDGMAPFLDPVPVVVALLSGGGELPHRYQPQLLAYAKKPISTQLRAVKAK